MSIVPETRAGKLQFYEAHFAPWTGNALAIGLTPESVTALAQRRLAESLIGDGDGLTLFGTIDCANLASRRTAARAGRREIASLWFLEPCSD